MTDPVTDHDMDTRIRAAAGRTAAETSAEVLRRMVGVSINQTSTEVDPGPALGEGSSEGGPRGLSPQAPGTMEDWLRRASRRRLSWTDRVDASYAGLDIGHPDPETGSINR